MSYQEAESRLDKVPADLIAEFDRRIREYARTRQEVNSRNAANNFLKAKVYGEQWRKETNDMAGQTMGILIRRILKDELGWNAENVEDKLTGRSYYIYRN